MSRLIRVDSEVYEAVRSRRTPPESFSDTLARMLREAGVEVRERETGSPARQATGESGAS